MKIRLNSKSKIYSTVLALLIGILFPVYAEAQNISNGDVNVQISWEEMNFTYIDSYGTWNPATHEAGTKEADIWKATGNNITVANNSTNRSIDARFVAKKSDAVTDNITVYFNKDEQLTSYDTGEIAPKNSANVTVHIAGKITESYEEIAQVTVSIIAK